MNTIQEQACHDLFYTQAYQVGINSFYHKVNELVDDDNKITRRTVEAWLKNQDTYQINVPQIQPKHIKPILTSRPFAHFQCDFVDFSNKPSKQYRYILVVIDIFSKYVWSKSLTNKTMKTTAKHMKDILDEIGPDRYPRVIQTDNEFKSEFSILCSDHHIKHIQNRSALPQSSGIVERVNKSIKTLLKRRVDQLGLSWSDHLQVVVKQYNDTVHSVIKDKPSNIETYTPEEIATLRDQVRTLKEREADNRNLFVPRSIKLPLSIGNKVRIKTVKDDHGKHFTKNWSDEKFTVVKIVKARTNFNVDRYQTDRDNRYYVREELQLVN
jgi:transposase InsO family protein